MIIPSLSPFGHSMISPLNRQIWPVLKLGKNKSCLRVDYKTNENNNYGLKCKMTLKIKFNMTVVPLTKALIHNNIEIIDSIQSATSKYFVRDLAGMLCSVLISIASQMSLLKGTYFPSYPGGI